MTRTTRKPQFTNCGHAPAALRSLWARSERGMVRRLALAALALGLVWSAPVGLGIAPAHAQDPSVTSSTSSTAAPSFQTPRAGLPSTKIDRSQPLYLQGDQLIYDSEGDKVIARGNVEIYFNNNILTADEVVYDQGAATLTAVGNVQLKEPNGNVVRADRYTLTDDFRDGFIESLRVTAADETRITARRAVRRDGNVTEFTDGKFTPCKTDGDTPPLWCISAQKVIHDQAAQTITYQDAAFNVFGVPIAYIPYFQHPDPTVKRKSGFLLPKYSTSSDLGFMAEVPYYFALAPNYDFTFRPAYSTQQGVLWQGDWRHRLENGQYTVSVAAIDQDADNLSVTADRADDLDGLRGSVETRGLFSLASWWQFGWDVTVESDDTFRRFYKLDNILVTDRVNTLFLRGQSDRNYFDATLYQFGGLLLDDTAQSESRTHPIIDHNYILEDPILGGELRVDSNILSFSRGDFRESGTSTQELNRVVSEVTWRKQMIDAIGITYTPFAYLRGDLYQFNNYVDPTTGNTVEDENIARGVAAGGVTVSYPWAAHEPSGTHIIEPIGQIIGRQNTATQDRLPNEDARSLIFDDTTLFEIDKFSGYDRIETGTRANVGLQYTFQTNWGGHARLLAGQSFHLSGENAFRTPGVDPDGNFTANPSSGLETDNSDYVLGAYIAPVNSFRLIGQSRFDDEGFNLRQQDIFAVANYGPFSTSVNYSFASNNPELGIEDTEQEITAYAAIQLTDRWSVSGSIRYDIDDDLTLTDAVRLRYADECFILTASYVETYIQDAERDIDPDRTIYLHFALKHLGDFQYKTDALDFVFGDDQPPQ